MNKKLAIIVFIMFIVCSAKAQFGIGVAGGVLNPGINEI